MVRLVRSMGAEVAARFAAAERVPDPGRFATRMLDHIADLAARQASR